jgi:small subunit ribosomal protein S16
MLKIRLARHGRKKAPFYRIVLTEHTKPAKAGYQTVLGRFNPLAHTMEAKIDEIKAWIAKGAKPSERVAKLLFADTKDEFFKKFFVERTRTK